MKSVSVSDLKANLSRYLREVKRGSEIQVLERGVPVARLVGLGPAPAHDPERRERLIRAGILRPGSGDASSILRTPPLRGADVAGALRDDREDRV